MIQNNILLYKHNYFACLGENVLHQILDIYLIYCEFMILWSLYYWYIDIIWYLFANPEFQCNVKLAFTLNICFLLTFLLNFYICIFMLSPSNFIFSFEVDCLDYLSRDQFKISKFYTDFLWIIESYSELLWIILICIFGLWLKKKLSPVVAINELLCPDP